MKKKIFALLTALCMTAAVLPAVFADGEEEPIECTCTTQCTAESKNEACPVCGVEGADLSQCIGLPSWAAGTQEQCSCVTICTDGNINSDCPVCAAEGVTACKGEPAQPVLFGAPRAVEVEIDETYFPDANFREYVKQKFNKNDNDVLTEAELNSVKEINVNNQGITDLTGIEHFTALTSLDCRSNQLTELKVSENKALTKLNCSVNQLNSLDVRQNIELKSLYCASNKLTLLDVSNNIELTELNCTNNALTKLDVSSNKELTELLCSRNQLTELDVSKNTALTELKCSENQLTSLEVNDATALTELRCDNNQLTSLDVSQNTALTELDCSVNQLTLLNVSKNTALTDLYCSDNQLTSLNVSENTALTELDCSVNQLNSLDVSSNTKLEYLKCSENQLNSLDVSKNTELGWLYCEDNQLNSLDVSSNTKLKYLKCSENQLNSLDVSKNTELGWLYCEGNQLTSLDVSQNTKLYDVDFSGQTRKIPVPQSADGSWSLDLFTLVDDWSRVSDITATGATLNDSTVSWTDGSVQPVVTYNYDVKYVTDAGKRMDVTLTLIPQQSTQPQPPQPTDPTTPETTAPTDTDNSGHAPVEDNAALPSFWDLVTQRINATPRGGEITINMGARAVPDSVLNALRARKLTATFRYGDTELTIASDQLPPEGTLTEWTLHELGNYVTEADESIRISVEKSEAENAAATETTAPAADTGKPNPATGETTTTAAAMLVAVVALTGLGVTLKKK